MTQVNFTEKYSKSKSNTLLKLAKVKKGEELEAILAILKKRGVEPEEVKDTVYVSDEALAPEELEAQKSAEANDGKAPKAKKEKKAKEPKTPRELKKQKTAEEIAAAKAEAEKNIGRFITFYNKKAKGELTGVIQSVRLDPRSNLLQYIIKVEGYASILGKAIDQSDFTIGEVAPKPEKQVKEPKAKKEKVAKADTAPVSENNTEAVDTQDAEVINDELA